MAQNFSDIPSTTTLKDSRLPLLDRDAAAASNFSGTAHPSSGLLVGQFSFRTDLGKCYALADATPTWKEIFDFSGATVYVPQALQLKNSRNFSITGDGTASAVAFNGTANVALSLTLANSGVTAGSYCKVTVDAKGRVTVGAALSSSDLPSQITVASLRLTSATQTGLGATGHGFQIGADAATNLTASPNTVQVRNNGAAGTLFLNVYGGTITLGDNSTSTINLNGLINSAALGMATLAEAQAGTASNKLLSPSRGTSLVDARFYSSGSQTITSGGQIVLAHGLASQPKLVNLVLYCVTAEAGYTSGQEVWISGAGAVTSTPRLTSVIADASNITIRYSDQTNAFVVAHATTGAATALTNANWRLRIKAMA